MKNHEHRHRHSRQINKQKMKNWYQMIPLQEQNNKLQNPRQYMLLLGHFCSWLPCSVCTLACWGWRWTGNQWQDHSNNPPSWGCQNNGFECHISHNGLQWHPWLYKNSFHSWCNVVANNSLNIKHNPLSWCYKNAIARSLVADWLEVWQINSSIVVSNFLS